MSICKSSWLLPCGNRFKNLIRFVNRDMFMHYVGGGVGHQDVMETQVDDPDDEGDEMDIEVDP